MLPLRDENPHPPGFKPTVTYALIIINVIAFLIQLGWAIHNEFDLTQFLEFSGQNESTMF